MDVIVVERPQRPRNVLEREAQRTGRTPAEELAALLRRHPTFAEAAGELGVSELTLRRWRRQYGVEVLR